MLHDLDKAVPLVQQLLVRVRGKPLPVRSRNPILVVKGGLADSTLKCTALLGSEQYFARRSES